MSGRDLYEKAWPDYACRVGTVVLLSAGLSMAWAVFKRMELLLLLIAGWWWSTSRLDKWCCPRCGNRFFARLYNNPFTDKCMHCGLPKWAKGPGDAA